MAAKVAKVQTTAADNPKACYDIGQRILIASPILPTVHFPL